MGVVLRAEFTNAAVINADILRTTKKCCHYDILAEELF
jgi:hypothetical protein